MVSKILMVLGPCCLAAGLWRDSTGLVAAGALWIVSAGGMEWYRRRAQAEADHRRAEATEAARETGEDTPQKVAPISGSTFLLGTALLLVTGVPALVIGWAQLGIADADASWRWLPLVVGAAATLLAVTSTLLYFVGAGITAVAGPEPTVPAEIVIVSMEQTGVYINEQPRIEFVLDVRPEGVEPYRVTKRATVPFTALGSLAVGKGFHALVVGSDDPTAMEIDWSAPLADEASPTSLSERLRALDDLREQDLITPDEYDEQRARLLDSL